MIPYTILDHYDNYLLDWELDSNAFGFLDKSELDLLEKYKNNYTYHCFTKTLTDEYVPWKHIFNNNSITNKQALREKYFFLIMTPHLDVMKIHNFLYELNKNNYIISHAWKHFPKELSNAINNNQCTFIINLSHEDTCRDKHVDYYWLKWFEFANIKNISNVCLLTSTHHNSKSVLNWIHWEHFETAVKNYVDVPKVNVTYHHNMKKFLCLNLRPNIKRIKFMKKLEQEDLLKDMNYSLVTETEHIEYDVFKSGYRKDTTIRDKIQMMPNNDPWNVIKSMFMKDNLIFIVTETCADASYLFLTEKIFKPIKMKMPFIVYARPHALRKLKEYGYKTFSSLWDESYDEIHNVNKRMDAIVQLVQSLNKLTTKELYDKIQDIKDILQHNYDNMMKRVPEQKLLDFIHEKTNN